jgi:hypothetical protein
MSMSLSMSPTPARTEIGTSTISALGFHADRDNRGSQGEADGDDDPADDNAKAKQRDREASTSRARRELSVIEERANEALSPTKSARLAKSEANAFDPLDDTTEANSGEGEPADRSASQPTPEPGSALSEIVPRTDDPVLIAESGPDPRDVSLPLSRHDSSAELRG